jgi:hypothetical protein
MSGDLSLELLSEAHVLGCSPDTGNVCCHRIGVSLPGQRFDSKGFRSKVCRSHWSAQDRELVNTGSYVPE